MSEAWIKDRLERGLLKLSDLAEMIPFAQRELGVLDDGKPGKATLRALREALEPERTRIPRTRREAQRLYGDPSWQKTGKGRRVDLDDAWEHENIRSFRLHTGKRVRMHRLVGDEFVRLFEKACQSGYEPKSVQTFVPRVIGGTKRLSYHALGIAADFNPSENPWGGRTRHGSLSALRQNMIDCEASGKTSFVETFESAGWTWGGRWKHPKTKEPNLGDDMHFQRCG